jgi:hypothetical protein
VPKLRIMTAVWGDNHLGWFERSCVRSLSWPENRKAIKDATWTIFTKKEDVEKATFMAAKTGVAEVEFVEISDDVQGNSPNMGAYLLQCLFYMMKACIKDQAKLLMAPPDTIFSEGSINALLVAGAQKGTCVPVPHPRVSPSIFGGIKDSPLSGAQLTSLAMKHGHRAWLEAEMGHPNQNSFIGGIAWQRVSSKIIFVQHRLPTVYLADFLPSDITFFQTPHDNLAPTFGCWDHAWPSDLIAKERWREIGSSDAACILEVTKEDLNVPPAHPVDKAEPDAYWRRMPHNIINRQFLYTMREE